MELRDIEYFSTVAEHGHLGRAAEALELSTPALSKSLRRLEKELQAKLVRRTPKGVELTAEGSALLAHVCPLRLAMHDITRKVADLRQGRSGHIRFGSTPGAADHLLPTAFSKLLEDAPGVTVSVTVEPGNPLLVSSLRNGQLDVIAMNLTAVPYEDIVQEGLYEEEFIVYASASHRLAARERVRIADLAQEEWAFPTMDGAVYKWTQRMFEDKGLPPPRVTLMGGPMQIRLQAIGSSYLLGLAPKRVVREVAARLRLAEIPVKDFAWVRHVGVGFRKDAYLSPLSRRFIEILKATAGEMAQ